MPLEHQAEREAFEALLKTRMPFAIELADDSARLVKSCAQIAFDAGIEFARASTGQPADDPSNPNAEWLTMAHLTCSECGIAPGHITTRMAQFRDWAGELASVADADAKIVDTYTRLHEGKLGAHWLWCVLEQVANGEDEGDALRAHGYVQAEAQGGADARRKLAAFGAAVLCEHRAGGYPDDVDGGVLQDIALEFGILMAHDVTEPCGESCVCADVYGFPLKCYRVPDDVRAAMHATSLPDGGA